MGQGLWRVAFGWDFFVWILSISSYPRLVSPDYLPYFKYVTISPRRFVDSIPLRRLVTGGSPDVADPFGCKVCHFIKKKTAIRCILLKKWLKAMSAQHGFSNFVCLRQALDALGGEFFCSTHESSPRAP